MTTIENCEDEPIRIPGSIQRHGFLLLLDEAGEHVVGASENTEEFFGIPLKLILGAPIGSILEREILAAVRSLTHPDDTPSLHTFLGSFKMRDELHSVVTHRIDGERVLELERLDRLVSPELMNAVITNFVAALSTLGGELELLQAITRQVKDLTGFNRVLLYQFDQAGHGTVLAEENDGALPSYLHLRFPASDIPRQARELYVLNTVRIIPDATYVPSPLRGVAQRPMGSLDLSMSVLRSVSPIHLEYMRNMGTRFEIVVRDDGAGMSKEVQRQLFQPFFSTKGDLGNGLGLYISNEIVERHGGRLLVESRLGRGTAMRIHLPANRVQISSQAEAIDPDMKQ